MQNNKLSPEGKQYILNRENFKSLPYLDEGKIWTIGYGFTYTPTKEQITAKTPPITKNIANLWFNYIVKPYVVNLNKVIKVNVNQKQFDALCSLSYNIGINNFNNSSVLRCLNIPDYPNAANHFMDWVKVTKIVNGVKQKVTVNGLVNRRTMDRLLFLGGNYV